MFFLPPHYILYYYFTQKNTSQFPFSNSILFIPWNGNHKRILYFLFIFHHNLQHSLQSLSIRTPWASSSHPQRPAHAQFPPIFLNSVLRKKENTKIKLNFLFTHEITITKSTPKILSYPARVKNDLSSVYINCKKFNTLSCSLASPFIDGNEGDGECIQAMVPSCLACSSPALGLSTFNYFSNKL